MAAVPARGIPRGIPRTNHSRPNSDVFQYTVDAGAEAGADGTVPPAYPLRRLSTPPIGTETQPSAEGRPEQSRGAEAETNRAMGVEERIAALRGDALRDELKRVLRTQTG